jgi:hypothetical protein
MVVPSQPLHWSTDSWPFRDLQMLPFSQSPPLHVVKTQWPSRYCDQRWSQCRSDVLGFQVPRGLSGRRVWSCTGERQTWWAFYQQRKWTVRHQYRHLVNVNHRFRGNAEESCWRYGDRYSWPERGVLSLWCCADTWTVPQLGFHYISILSSHRRTTHRTYQTWVLGLNWAV